MASVWKMDWTERERGWGQRPDGCSLHSSKQEWERYWSEAKSRMPKEAPDEYEWPDAAEPTLAPCSEGLAALVAEEGSLRLSKGSAAMDGGLLAERGQRLSEACQAALARAERAKIAQAAGPGQPKARASL